ncbi:MAG: hypothetical protein ACK55Z_18785, partial [bacterium]
MPHSLFRSESSNVVLWLSTARGRLRVVLLHRLLCLLAVLHRLLQRHLLLHRRRNARTHARVGRVYRLTHWDPLI